jgi:protein arginine N-methyltransferase 1
VYSIRAFGDMIADTRRFNAYAQAISECVRQGDVVVEIGAGPALFSILACKAGARRVYAIETEDILQTAKEIAVANGCADRIEFLQSNALKTVLPERANIVISDIRGVLPLFNDAVNVLQDAKHRFLAENGLMIPRRDLLMAAIVDAHKTYPAITSPWKTCVPGVDLSIPLRHALNTNHGTRVTPEDVLTEVHQWWVLDHMGDASHNVSAEILFRVKCGGTGNGICIWFETELTEGICYSSGPGGGGAEVYGQMFLPWMEPMVLIEGQEIRVRLHANLVGSDYIWRWETETTKPGGTGNVHFQQSTFEGANVSSVTLRHHATGYVPVLRQEGEAERFLLGAMDGKLKLEEIAELASRKFPEVYPKASDAFERAAKLASKFSR